MTPNKAFNPIHVRLVGADVISFGVAPAALAFAAGMRGGWDWIALIYLMISKTLRIPKI